MDCYCYIALGIRKFCLNCDFHVIMYCMELLKSASLLISSFVRVSGFSRNRMAVVHVPSGDPCD